MSPPLPSLPQVLAFCFRYAALPSDNTAARHRLGYIFFLSALTAAGLVRRIQPANSLARYESRVGDNHHHVVCRSCGTIRDVDCAVGDAPCLTASDDQGFDVDEAEVIYWGLCPDCSAQHTSRSHP